jgi:hypothetical protein
MACRETRKILAGASSVAGRRRASRSPRSLILQSRLRPKLAALRDELTGAVCYCDGEEKTGAALGQIGRLGKVFADAGAAQPALST